MEKIGTAFVAQAEKIEQGRNQEMYQQCVTDIIRKITESETTIRIGNAALKHFRAQKEALEAGKFHFHLFRKAIVFDDEVLNKNYQEL
jgi:hypothetical protein